MAIPERNILAQYYPSEEYGFSNMDEKLNIDLEASILTVYLNAHTTYINYLTKLSEVNKATQSAVKYMVQHKWS